MIGFARLVIVALLLLGLIYIFAVRFFSSRREAQLNDAWTPDRGNKQIFVQEELAAYRKALRPKLAFVIFVLPMVYFAIVLYLSNSA